MPGGTSDLYGVSARTTSDVWAVGDTGNILHFNGSAWSVKESGTERRLNGVKSLASDNVWAVGDKGTIMRYDGSAWSQVQDGVAGFTLESLAYDSGDNVLYGGGSGKGVWRCTEPNANPSWYDISGAVDGFTMNALVATGGRVYGAASFNGVWRCESPLAELPTWTDIGDSAWKSDTVYSLASDGTRLYAGGQGVWRCDNPAGAAGWTDTGGRVSDKIVRSLAYDGADNVLFAGTQGQGVWRGIQPDTEPVWLNTAGVLSEQVVRSLACDSSNDILFAGTEGRGVRSAGAGPVPTVLVGSPGKGDKGTTMNVALTGAETSFANGVSAATFGSGITVNSTTVTDATHATASITISNDAAAGKRDVNVVTGAEAPEALAEGFRVVRPKIASVSPASQGQGQTLDILIWGEDTHFVQGSSRAAVSGGGVTVNSTTVTSPTEAKANITISQTAEPGTRQVNVVTGAETPDALTGLKVLTAKPLVDLMYPTSGPVGTEVTIMGKNFGTSRGSSKVTFNGTAAAEYTYWSGYLVKCVVPEGAATGLVKVVTPGGTSNGKNFTVTKHEGPVGLTWTWYLAEGSTDWGFDTYITMTNPNASGVTADVTYMTSEGPKEHAGLWLPPLSQTTLSPRADVGEADFSTRVVCTTEYEPIAVDRTMLWTGPGAPSEEGHSSIGVTAPATEWYLPEGSSAMGVLKHGFSSRTPGIPTRPAH